MFKLSKQMAARRVERYLRAQIGTALARALYSFGWTLDAWAGRVLSELRLRFDSEADKYRAHLVCLSDGRTISQAEAISLQLDLERLAAHRPAAAAETGPGS